MNSLFFTDGATSYLGLIIFSLLLSGIALKNKNFVVLSMPIMVLLTFEYFSNGLGWHGIIMLLNVVFIMVQSIRGK